MKKHKKTMLSWVLMFSVLMIPITSCEKEDYGDAPDLPPKSSFVMDFSDFLDEEKSQFANETYHHRNTAIFHIAVWNTVIFLHMAIPVAAFTGSFNHDPSPQPDGSWLWSYSVNVGANTYTANLYGKGEGINVEWKMYISKSGHGAFDDFLWFEGNSHIAGIEGHWILYKSPTENIPFVRIDWFNNVDGTSGISYTNIIPGGPENGGYISHEVTKDTPYDASYDIFNKGQNNLVEINWNRLAIKGQIRDPKTFGDEEFYCWDENGVDIECP